MCFVLDIGTGLNLLSCFPPLSFISDQNVPGGTAGQANKQGFGPWRASLRRRLLEPHCFDANPNDMRSEIPAQRLAAILRWLRCAICCKDAVTSADSEWWQRRGKCQRVDAGA
jgi:hypothetical protein